MPYQPIICNRHGEEKENRSVRGWSVVDLTTYRPVVELGQYGPREARLAITAALLLDALVHGPAPEVRLEPGPRADLLNYSLLVAWTRKRLADPALQVGIWSAWRTEAPGAWRISGRMAGSRSGRPARDRSRVATARQPWYSSVISRDSSRLSAFLKKWLIPLPVRSVAT